MEGFKTIFSPCEIKRTYCFPEGNVELFGVNELIVRPSGTHRLKTNDGHLHIIPSGWLHIDINSGNEYWQV